MRLERKEVRGIESKDSLFWGEGRLRGGGRMEEFDYIMSISGRLEAGKWVVAVGRR
jgi:hypothetical protein